jgi:hypothetical protein
VDSTFDDWIYWTSVSQLHLIITAHTLKSFWIISLLLSLFWISGWSLSLLLLSTTQGFSATTESIWVWLLVLCYDRRSVGQSVLEQSAHLGLTIRFLLLSESCWSVNVGRSLWREDGSVVYNCCWPSPARSFSGPSPVELVTIFYFLRFETSLFVAS